MPSTWTVDSNDLEMVHDAVMVETTGLKLLNRPDRIDSATWTRGRMVAHTDSESWKIVGNTHSTAWTSFSLWAALLLQQIEKQLFLEVCDEGQVEQLEHPHWSKSSCEKSIPDSVSLMNAFSFSMTDRYNAKMLVSTSPVSRSISINIHAATMASRAARE